MISYRIEYVGPAMSGRTESLTRVLCAAGTNASAMTIDLRKQFTFPWRHTERLCSVIAGVSVVRAHLYYEDPTDPTLDSGVAHEIDRLARADGLAFVIDSQIVRADGNLEAWDRLRCDLASRDVDLDLKPIVFQVNKRDLPDPCSLDWVRERFHVSRCAYVESVAVADIGPAEAMNELLRLIAAGC